MSSLRDKFFFNVTKQSKYQILSSPSEQNLNLQSQRRVLTKK